MPFVLISPRISLLVFVAVSVLVAATALFATSSGSPNGHSIYGFSGSPGGAGPDAGLVADQAGRLYGVTQYDGSFGDGTVFRLTPPQGGSGPWTEEVLHSFNGSDGVAPDGKLALDGAGAVYGTTVEGSTFNGGTVFRLDNLPGWPITTLHAFRPRIDGGIIREGVVFGPNGLLYGTTDSGGYLNRDGTAFSVSPLGDTTEFAVIQRFGIGASRSLYGPDSGLVGGNNGRFFGTAGGGLYSRGAVFTLSLRPNGRWVQDTIYSFGVTNDLWYGTEAGGLIQGLSGELYGCAVGGGTHGIGGVFRLTPPLPSGGAWTEAVLYNFGSQPSDPDATGSCGLTLEPSGNLIGTTLYGGTFGYGTIFELAPPSAGQGFWTETVLENFSPQSQIGNVPTGPLLRDGAIYYGINFSSPSGLGTVFEFKP